MSHDFSVFNWAKPTCTRCFLKSKPKLTWMKMNKSRMMNKMATVKWYILTTDFFVMKCFNYEPFTITDFVLIFLLSCVKADNESCWSQENAIVWMRVIVMSAYTSACFTEELENAPGFSSQQGKSSYKLFLLIVSAEIQLLLAFE